MGLARSNGLTELSDANFQAEVMASKKPYVVGFRAEWCRTSREMAPTMHELAEKYRGRVSFGQVNVDDDFTLVEEYGVHTLPTLLIFKDGALVQPLIGGQTKSTIEHELQRLL